MEPSASTGAARTTVLGSKPGWATMGRASCVWRSQLAVLLASQIPLKSGLPAMRPRPDGAVTAAAEACGALCVISEKRPAVAAAADAAMTQPLPQLRMFDIAIFLTYGQYLRNHSHRADVNV